ncbi:MAG: hypothetical protein WC836_13190 [Desulfobacula sp.]|jgi:hypothetical protein
MPLPETLTININDLPDKPKAQTADPTPFDVDGYVNTWSKTNKIEDAPIDRGVISNVLHSFTRPFLAQGYNTVAALNRGVASFSAHLDSVSDFIESTTGMKKGGLFEQAAKTYTENADHWKKRAEEVGMNFFDELISDAVGGAVPGVTQFVMDVESAYTLPFMAGYAEAGKKGESPFMNGILEAAKTKTLHSLFQMMAPLNTYLKAPTMGTVFGVQEMAEAPEGKKGESFAKGLGTGLMYSIASPGGRLGLNDIKKSVEIDLAKRKSGKTKKLAPESPQEIPPLSPLPKGSPETQGQEPAKPTGSISGRAASPEAPTIEITKEAGTDQPEKQSQRKFLKTVAESATTLPEFAEKVKEIDPQNYTIQPNVESMTKAQSRIEETGIDGAMEYLRSDAVFDAEKSAVAIDLMGRFQKEGNIDQALEVLKLADTQGREAGRGIQMLSMWNRLTPSGFIRWAEKELDTTRKKYGWLDTLFDRKPDSFKLTDAEKAEIFKRMLEINKMPDGIDKTDATLQVIDVVARKTPPSVSELIDAYRYQNMLSSPRTHQRNIGENTGNAFITRPIDITTRGAIDYFKASLFGTERQAYVNDTPVYMKAALNAVPNAAKGFMATLKAEKGMELGKPELGVEVKSEFERARFKQIPTALTMIQRFLEAQDKFYSAIIGAGEMAVQKKRGVSDAEAYKNASEIAEKYLYRDKLEPNDPALSYFSKALSSTGKIITDSRKLPGLGLISKLYVPFIRTPINKGIQMVERSPLGLARGNFDQEAVAKIISGSIITAIGAGFAFEGETTWSVPPDPKEKEMFYASGRKAFSVKIGEKWIPVWYLGPYALAFAIPMAVKHYVYDQKKAVTSSALDNLLDIANGTARFIGSQTSTQSVGSLFSALSGDIDYSFPSTTAFTLEQFFPAQGLVRYANTIIDPIYRKPKNFYEHIEKDLPLLSQNLEPRRTPFFEESRRDPVNYFLPYDIGKSEPIYESMLPQVRYELRNSNIEKEMNKLSEKIRTGEISPEESINRLAELFGAQTKSLEIFGEELK